MESFYSGTQYTSPFRIFDTKFILLGNLFIWGDIVKILLCFGITCHSDFPWATMEVRWQEWYFQSAKTKKLPVHQQILIKENFEMVQKKMILDGNYKFQEWITIFKYVFKSGQILLR